VFIGRKKGDEEERRDQDKDGERKGSVVARSRDRWLRFLNLVIKIIQLKLTT